jgi:hypothetical protein
MLKYLCFDAQIRIVELDNNLNSNSRCISKLQWNFSDLFHFFAQDKRHAILI